MATITLPRGELAYAQITADSATNATNTPADVAGLTVTVTTGTRPIKVSFSGLGTNTQASSYAAITIMQDGVQVANAGGAVPGAGGIVNFSGFTVLTPSAGSHVYKVQLANGGGGTAKISAAATQPATLLVEEI